MAEAYDLLKSLLSTKASERMIAFAGFVVQPGGDAARWEGVLKIAASHRSNGSGYLTLTFIVDTEGDSATRDALAHSFKVNDQASLQALIGKELEMLLEIPLDSFAHAQAFFIWEIHLYFQMLRGQEQRLLNGKVIPALARTFHCAFEPLEWLPEKAEPAPAVAPSRESLAPSGGGSLKALFNRWFQSS